MEIMVALIWLLAGIIAGESLYYLEIKKSYRRLLSSYYTQWKEIRHPSLGEKETQKLIIAEGFTQLRLLGKLILMLFLLLLPFLVALFIWNLNGRGWIEAIFSAHFIIFGSIGILIPAIIRKLLR
jgi:uncharacterized ion transporter superfamily protein YfcC